MYVRVTGALNGIGPRVTVTWRPGPDGGRWSVRPDPKDVEPAEVADVRQEVLRAIELAAWVRENPPVYVHPSPRMDPDGPHLAELVLRDHVFARKIERIRRNGVPPWPRFEFLPGVVY